MKYRLTLDYTSPENLVTASNGNMFYRRGESLFIIDARGINSLSISKRSFLLNHPIYKRTAGKIPLDRYDIFYSKPQELWVKTGGTGKTGWKFAGVKSPVLPKPVIPAPGVDSGIVFVTYE